MKKVFNIYGAYELRFAKESKEQIITWLDGVDYDFALEFAKEVDCPVFGKALDFPACLCPDIN